MMENGREGYEERASMTTDGSDDQGSNVKQEKRILDQPRKDEHHHLCKHG